MTNIPAVRLYVDRQGEQSWVLHVGHATHRGRRKTEPHAHPGYGQLILVDSGRGTLNLEGREFAFEGPCALLLPPNCVHGFDYEADIERWVLTIEISYLKTFNARLREFISLWSAPRTIPLSFGTNEASALFRLVSVLKRELESDVVGCRVAAEALLTNLQLMLVREATVRACIGNSVTGNGIGKVERFRKLIDEHFRENWALKDYALKMGLSLTQLRAACASTPEKSPTKMIHSRIITEAKRHLIFGEMTVTDIAFALGFADAAYFTHFFRRETGQPPTQFRLAARRQTHEVASAH